MNFGLRRQRPSPVAMMVLAAVVGVIIGVLITAASPDGPTQQEQSLARDPMGSFVPVGTKVIRTRSLGENDVRGKYSVPRAASRLRFFSVPDGQGQRVLGETIARAKAAGWRVRSGKPGVSAGLAKTLPTGPVALSIWLVDNRRTAAGWNLPNPFFEVLLSYDDWRFRKFGLALVYK